MVCCLSVVESQCRYLAPARYDQEIVLATADRRRQSTARRVPLQNSATQTTQQLLARGATKHMWLNRDFKPTKLPERYLQILKPLS